MGKNLDVVNLSQYVIKDKAKAIRLNLALNIDQQISDIFDRIEKLPNSLTSLNLAYNFLQEKHLFRLVEILKKYKNLDTLGFKGNFKGEHTNLMLHLKNIIINHPKLDFLNLKCCDITDQDLRDLMNNSHGIKLSYGICRPIYILLDDNKITSQSADLALSGQFCTGTINDIKRNINDNDPQPAVQEKLEEFYHGHFNPDFKYSSKTPTLSFEQSVMRLRSGRSKP